MSEIDFNNIEQGFETWMGIVGDAIRERTDTTNKIPPKNMDDLIRTIQPTSILPEILERNIATLIIPDNLGLTTLFDYAFAGCELLTKIRLPNTLKSVNGYHAFNGCGSLKEVSIPCDMRYGSDPATIDTDTGTFSGCFLTKLRLSKGSSGVMNDFVLEKTQNIRVTNPSQKEYSLVNSAYVLGTTLNSVKIQRSSKIIDITSSTEYIPPRTIFVNVELEVSDTIVVKYYDDSSDFTEKFSNVPWKQMDTDECILDLRDVHSIGKGAFARYPSSDLCTFYFSKNLRLIDNYAFYRISTSTTIKVVYYGTLEDAALIDIEPYNNALPPIEEWEYR